MSVPCGSTRKGVRVNLTWNILVQRHCHWLGAPLLRHLGICIMYEVVHVTGVTGLIPLSWWRHNTETHHWPFVRGIQSSGFSSQKTDDAGMWCFLWCGERVDVQVIWDVYCLRALYGPQMKKILGDYLFLDNDKCRVVNGNHTFISWGALQYSAMQPPSLVWIKLDVCRVIRRTQRQTHVHKYSYCKFKCPVERRSYFLQCSAKREWDNTQYVIINFTIKHGIYDK